VCRADLKLERRLETEVGALPLDVERGWAAMSRRLEQEAAGPSASGRRKAMLAAGRAAPWLGWAAAAGLAGIMAIGAISPTPAQPARYHALASTAAVLPGNALVVFRPDATQAQILAALRASDARLADGPTTAGAYVLHVPIAGRDQALLQLRGHPAVAMAEPISAPAP
jgi:hypothetical protein